MLGCGSALASLGLTRYNRESRLRGGYPIVTAFVTLVEFGAVARDTAFSPRLRLPALSANRSPPSRSAPPRHPSRASPRQRCVSFAQSAAALSAPPWFDTSLLDNVARSPFYAGEDMKHVCHGLSSEAMWQGLMNERSDARRLRFARGASERRAWQEATL